MLDSVPNIYTHLFNSYHFQLVQKRKYVKRLQMMPLLLMPPLPVSQSRRVEHQEDVTIVKHTPFNIECVTIGT